jgi:CRP-like cAMP-binding protein
MWNPNGNQHAADNQLLSSLSSTERARLLPAAQCISLSAGQVLDQSRELRDHIYFPTTAVISWFYTTRDGSIAEIYPVGNDGLIGLSLLLGGDTNPYRAVVQISGNALRIPAMLMQTEFARGGQFQRVILLYTQGLMTRISQRAVCNCLHSVEKRLCHWLLVCHDRVERSEILMTQEYIANMLGGRRESITVAAGRLQEAGLIHYSRGHISVVNRGGLEELVCECYRTVEDEIERLVGVRNERHAFRSLHTRPINN